MAMLINVWDGLPTASTFIASRILTGDFLYAQILYHL